jgi:5-methylcytosine-specific restriction endonuclease McrA
VTYRCQGCRNYHREVYRTIGLGSVCSPECEATVRTRQRGGRAATKPHGRDSQSIESAPGAGDSTDNTQAAPGRAGDSTSEVPVAGDPEPHAASGDTDDGTTTRGRRDGTHNSTSWSGDHDSKKSLREGTFATRGVSGSSRQHVLRRARSRDCVLERDQRCRYCGTRRNLHVHHINYKSQGGSHDPHNLITLCNAHHDLVHTNKGLWQPILRAYIWLLYIEGRRLFLLEVKRIYG